MTRSLLAWAFVATAFAVATAPGYGQLPAVQLQALAPQGGQAGQTVTVTVSAANDRQRIDGLVFSHPGITATLKMAEAGPFDAGPKKQFGTFDVQVAADVPEGVYEARAAGLHGLSNPRGFLVTRGPRTAGAADRQSAEKPQRLEFPATVDAVTTNEAVDHYAVAAPAGTRVVVEVFARRLDSKCEPVVTAVDARGRTVATARTSRNGDPVLEFVADGAGEHRLRIHDVQFRGGAEYGYVLSVSGRPRVWRVEPAAIAAGATREVAVFGTELPGGVATGETLDGRPMVRVTTTVTAPKEAETAVGARLGLPSSAGGVRGFAWALETPAGKANPVLMGLTPDAVVLETEPNDQAGSAQAVPVPCDVTARFGGRTDVDWYQFPARKGDTYWVEVIGERSGSGCDPFVVVQRVAADGATSDVGEADDGPRVDNTAVDLTSDDPALKFTAGEDGTYRVLVRDLAYAARGAAGAPYRVLIRPGRPDFDVAAWPHTGVNNAQQARPTGLVVRRGGTSGLNVAVIRQDGFEGPVEVTAEGLPAGVTVAPVVVHGKQTVARVVFAGAEDAAVGAGTARLVARARIGEQEVVRPVRMMSSAWVDGQNRGPLVRWHAGGDVVALSVLEDPFPIAVRVAEGTELATSRAGKIEIPLTAVRRGDFKGNLQLQPYAPPPGVRAANVALNGDAKDAKLAIELPANLEPGRLSLVFDATTQVKLARDAFTAKELAAEVERLNGVVTQLEAAAKAASEAKAAADAAVTKGEAEAKAAEEAKKAAEAAVTTARAELDAATKAATAAAEAAAAKADDATLQEAKAGTEAARVKASEKLAGAEAAAKAAVEAAGAMAKAAAEAKTAQATATQTMTEAAAKAKAATDHRTAVIKGATEAAKEANPTDANVFEPALVVTIDVAASPVDQDAGAPVAEVAAGGKGEAVVRVARRFGFAEAVEIEPVVPGELKGVKASKGQIAAGQTEGPIAIELTAEAAAGEVTIPLKIRVRLNNQALETAGALKLKITPAK